MLVEHGMRDLLKIKSMVRMDEVGFDPTGTDPGIKCNLYGGWPTQDKQGCCDRLLELLEYLCSNDEKPGEISSFVLKWLAYPIQHPGAKMQTALICHGPQGVGKNLFFEPVMTIYGHYGRIVDQAALEDKFNDWASKKLFLIADEVVARQELYHNKNRLKVFVTGTWIHINTKNVAAHQERNHINIVFTSNESQPLVLEKDDRRYAVIHTPNKLLPEFYQQVRDEINAGGIAALHHHLLHVELGDFDEHTKPPMTRAKRDLVERSLDSPQRFVNEWKSGEIDLPFIPCASMDLFSAYLKWCSKNGIKHRDSATMLGEVGLMGGFSNKPRHIYKTEAQMTSGNSKHLKPARTIEPDDPSEEDLDALELKKKPDDSMAVWLSKCRWKFKEKHDEFIKDQKT
jgi:putative DNA primase/helicase